jgi:outer membrane murein-binding lipoprotein Lpp
LRSLPTVGNQYWSQLSSHVSQLQWQVDELKKKVASPATNSVPEEKSGK